jgi:hypothetical protein
MNDNYDVSPSNMVIHLQQRQPFNLPATLLGRELGHSQTRLRQMVHESLGPTMSFHEMSGDVECVSFTPDGAHFAASACCFTDDHNMQYNNQTNLVIGNQLTKTITELADHWTPRHKPTAGINSTEEMYLSQDSRLFHTVPMVQFSHDSHYLYSIGYDGMLSAYNTSDSLVNTSAKVNGQIATLNVSSIHGGIATGSRISSNSVAIWTHRPDHGVLYLETTLQSKKAVQKQSWNIYPTSLKWGNKFRSNILAAGFSSNKGHVHGRDRDGELCLWDINTQSPDEHRPLRVIGYSGSIQDVCWSPLSPYLAVAIVPSCSKSFGSRYTKSVIRLYDDLGPQWDTRGIEFDCLARDINDVVFWYVLTMIANTSRVSLTVL